MQEHVLLATRGQEVGVYLQNKSPSAVRIAAQNFCRDLNKICGCRAFLTEEANSAVFLIGILGEDAEIDALAGDTVKDLRDESGELRWESYLIKLLNGGRAVLAGHGRRGAIYAFTNFPAFSAFRLGISLPMFLSKKAKHSSFPKTF